MLQQALGEPLSVSSSSPHFSIILMGPLSKNNAGLHEHVVYHWCDALMGTLKPNQVLLPRKMSSCPSFVAMPYAVLQVSPSTTWTFFSHLHLDLKHLRSLCVVKSAA